MKLGNIHTGRSAGFARGFSFLTRIVNSKRHKSLVFCLLLSVFYLPSLGFAANPVLINNYSFGDNNKTNSFSTSVTNTSNPANYNMMLVMVGQKAQEATTSVTWGSTNFTIARTQDCGGTQAEFSEIWYAVNVPLGTNTLTINYAAKIKTKGISVLTYEGVSQAHPISSTGGFCEYTNNFFTHSTTIGALNTNSRIVGFEARRRGGTPPQFTGLSGVTKIHDFTTSATAFGNAQRSFASGHMAITTTGTKTFGFTSNEDQRYSIVAAEIGGYQTSQGSYRLFNNIDSTNVGTPLAAQNTAVTLTSTNQTFRLRQLMGVSLTSLALSGKNFQLQYAVKSGTCDTNFVGETYSTINAFAGPIRMHGNASAVNGTALTPNANDPTDGRTIVNQSYIADFTANFSNNIGAIPIGQDGKWDFSLRADTSAPGGTTYCLRMIRSDGQLLDNYFQIPEVTTYAPPVVEGASYRFYHNQDGAYRVGSIGLKNTPITAPTQGSPFRLRQLLHLNSSGASMGLSSESFKLQVAQRSGTCDTAFVGETYSDVGTSSGAIRYYNNPTPADGDPLAAWFAGDPIDLSTVHEQTYEESNNFTNGKSAIPSGEDGMWDFSLQDFSASPDTSYCLRVVRSTGATLSTYTQIAEFKTAPSVTLSRNNPTIAEATGVSTFTATLSQTTDFDVTVNLSFTGTATGSGTDYNISSASINIPAGSLTGTMTVTAAQDTLDEDDETVIVDITSVVNATESGTQQQTTTILDDDNPPTVTLTRNNATIAEAAGISTFTATLSAASSKTVTVNLGFSGTATGSGTDYNASAASIVINPLSTTGSITVTAVQDTLDEDDETVIVDITTVTNGTESGIQQATTTILDDDNPPTVTLSRNNATIAEAAGVSTFTATLSTASSKTVTVNLGFSGTATGSGTDYNASAASIVINPLSTTGSITVTAVQDTLDENNETVIVDITSVTNGTESGTQQQTTTITDDDNPPTVTLGANNANIAEAAGVATFTATLSTASSFHVTVDLGFSGTAGASDYTESGNQIVISAGDTTGSITVTADQDTLDENNETVIVDITSVTNGTESGTQQQTTTITDDDNPPTVTLGVNSANIAEAAGVATFTATLSAVSGLDVTVDLGLTGTASASDYTESATQIVISAGDTTGSITVTADQDTLDENNETVIVDITSVTNGTESGTQQQTTTITDDDTAPTVTLAVDTTPIAEASGVATFTATLSTASGLDVTIDLGFTGTASASDYTESDTQIVILAGDTTGAITVTADQDTLDENDETVIVDITSVTNGTESGTQQQTTTITDDDNAPTVTLSVNNANIAEAAGIATFTATLSAASSFDVTVDLGFSGSASASDYTESGNQIVISAGDTSGSITVTADQDALDENNETVIVDITSVTNGTESGTQQASTTITDDDDAPTVTLSVDNDPIAEAGGIATFTASLSTISGLDVTVDLALSGTASASDYTESGTQIIISAGDTTGSITVTADDDTLDENDETVIVDIDSVTNGTESGTQQESTTITDDDASPSVTLAVDNDPIAENAGVATFTATLSTASGLDVTVDLTLSGTAGASDYTESGTQIVISAGDTTGSITVTADDDLLDENNETVIVDIDSVTNGTESGTQQESTTITDDDDAPTVTLAVDNDPIAENAGVATFTATLSSASSFDVTVDLALSGTAGASDYTESATQIVITAGDTTGSITITADDDLLDENDETVIVDIDAVTNGTESGTQQASTTITDDDDAPTVTLAVDNNPIAENGGVATFTATLSAASSFDVTVDLALSGTAGASDYTESDTQIVISAGDTEGSITVTADDDLLDENDETVIVDIDAVTNGTEDGSQQATTTITDDDDAPTVTLAVDNDPIAENGGVATFTATLSAASSFDVTVDLALSGTAGASDYTESDTQIVISAGDTEGSITVTADDDLLDENDETVIVDIDAVTNGTESGTQQQSATITDDDDAPTVTLAVDNDPIAENGGVATFTATLSAASSFDVTVDLTLSGTAGASDYTESGTQIVISAGDTTGSITITADDDTLDENDETVIVDIDAVTNGTEDGSQQATTTITDDDDAPTVTLAVDNDPIAENAGVATFTATLSAASSFDVTVDLALSGTADASDYTESGNQIVISAGDTTGSITVTTDDDLLDENDETVIVDIDAVTNGTESGTQQESTTITDDDDAPTVTLAVDNDPIAENGGVATFTATLSAASSFDVTVDLALSGTAGASDYTESGTQIVITAGDTTGTITVTADDDTLDENDETVIVDIDAVTNGTESGTQQQSTTITDDDDAPTVTLAVDNDPIAENAGVATFTATLSAASSFDVTVDLALSGTAGASDYTESDTQIVISAGDTTGTITVTADDDTLDENDETVIVDITSVTNGTESGTQQASTTITDDDDAPTVTLAVDNDPIAENGGVATFTATLSAASSFDVTVDLALSGTAGASDYTESDTQIVISAGDTEGSITVTADDDTLDENDETVIVDIDSVTNGTESGTQQESTTITDDDDAPTVTLAVDNDPIAENGGVATFTATLSATSSLDVTVDLGFSGTASGSDYTASDNQIVISAGDTEGSIIVTADDDILNEGDETVIVDITSVTNGTESGLQQQTTTITDDDVVFNGTISGTISLSNLSASPLEDVIVSDGTRQATSDSNGNFTINNVPAGNYALTADKEGYKIVLDGSTNPITADFLASPSLLTTTYSYWTSFLNIGNILEIENQKSIDLVAIITPLDKNGLQIKQYNVTIPGKTKRDLILFPDDDFPMDEYGLVKIELNHDSYNGRMTYYRSADNGTDYDFSFSKPFTNPFTGNSFVSFNTIQPSYLISDIHDFVGQWLSIANLNTTTAKKFLVNHYDQEGNMIGSKIFNVPAQGRVDIEAGHVVFGENGVGLNEIIPYDSSSPYTAMLVRYGQTGPANQKPVDFNFATSFASTKGKARTVYAPFRVGPNTSSWLETVNGSNKQLSLTIRIYDSNGVLRSSFPGALKPKGQQHFSLNSIFPTNSSANGFVEIVPGRPNSLTAQTMVYNFNASTMKVSTATNYLAREPFGLMLYGAYNLYLGATNELALYNLRGSATTVTLIVYSDPNNPKSKSYSIPANGRININLNDPAKFGTSSNTIGLFRVATPIPGSIWGKISRVRTTSEVDFSSSSPLR